MMGIQKICIALLKNHLVENAAIYVQIEEFSPVFHSGLSVAYFNFPFI